MNGCSSFLRFPSVQSFVKFGIVFSKRAHGITGRIYWGVLVDGLFPRQPVHFLDPVDASSPKLVQHLRVTSDAAILLEVGPDACSC